MIYEFGDIPNAEKRRDQIGFLAKIYLVIINVVQLYIFYCFYCYFNLNWKYLLLGNALLGWFLLEWAWYNTTRIHEVDEARDSCFEAFRRPEAKHWNKLLMYPLAMTVLPARMWGAIAVCPGTATFSNIILFGYK